MKNKIVKALVLASIVSMTATGAAGLTFAEPAPKTIDEQAEAITKQQQTVDKAKADFDKSYAYLEAVEAASTAYKELSKQEQKTAIDLRDLDDKYYATNEAYQAVKDAYNNVTNDTLIETERNWIQSVETDGFGDSKSRYEAAKKTFEDKLKKASEDKDLKEDIATIQSVLALEDAPRAAFEEAMKAVETAKKDYKPMFLAEYGKAYGVALRDLRGAVAVYGESTKDLPPIYRLYHPGTGEHLYTDSKVERDALVKGGIWQDEKVAMLSAKKSEDAIPVYRVCYPLTGDHHYTTSKNEVDTLIKTQGWVDEGIAFHAVATGKGVSVYRLYNKGLKLGAHHFTTGLNEYNALESHGWIKEGVAFDAVAKDYVDTSTIKATDERVKKAYDKVGDHANPTTWGLEAD